MKLLSFVPALAALVFSATAAAADPEPTAAEKAEMAKVEKILSGFKPQEGTITVAGGKVKIALTPDYQYLNPADTAKMIVDVWHNPPGTGGGTEGMILPKGDEGWSAIL